MHQDKVKYPIFSLIGTLMVVLAIGLGAYGAHGLEDAFSKAPRMEKAWGNGLSDVSWLSAFYSGYPYDRTKKIQVVALGWDFDNNRINPFFVSVFTGGSLEDHRV